MSAVRRSFALGAGFAVTIGVLAGGVFLYINRPRPELPWNSRAFQAAFSDIDVWENVGPDGKPDDRGTVEFTYFLENRSGSDYSSDGSAIVAMVQRPDGLIGPEGDVRVKLPIFIPAGQRVAVKIAIPYGRELAAVHGKSDSRKLVREKLPKLAGFVLFDRAKRYRIELPMGW